MSKRKALPARRKTGWKDAPMSNAFGGAALASAARFEKWAAKRREEWKREAQEAMEVAA